MSAASQTHIYLRLFNGRQVAPASGEPTPAEEVTFGPFAYVHEHSNGNIWLGESGRLFTINGSVFYNGALYHDRLIFCDAPDSPPVGFEEEKAIPRRREGER